MSVDPRVVTPQKAQSLASNWVFMNGAGSTVRDLVETVTTEPERTRAAQEQAWDAACDYLSSRNFKDLTHAEYTAALLKAWNANPHREVEATLATENERLLAADRDAAYEREVDAVLRAERAEESSAMWANLAARNARMGDEARAEVERLTQRLFDLGEDA